MKFDAHGRAGITKQTIEKRRATNRRRNKQARKSRRKSRGK